MIVGIDKEMYIWLVKNVQRTRRISVLKTSDATIATVLSQLYKYLLKQA